MADVDIDSLLEAGIKAAQQSKREDSGDNDDGGATATERDDDGEHSGEERDRERRARRKSRRSRSPASRSKSRSRSARRSSRRRERRRSPRSRSRSRSSRRQRSSRRRARSRSRSRSRSPRRRRSSRRGSRRSRSRSRSARRARSRSRSRSRSRARSTSAERAERAKQRELMELTRDHRTVFVGQLTQKVRERDLAAFFGGLGKLERVLLIRDKYTNRSKGFAYVELSHLEDVPKALLLNGCVPPFQAFPLLVKASEAEKNFAAKKDSAIQAAAAGSTAGPSAAGSSSTAATGDASRSAASRVFCGNLHAQITEDDLRSVFQAFGDVLSVSINRDELGRSRGFGFIQFGAPDEAALALAKGDGLELAGHRLRLGAASDPHGGGTGGRDREPLGGASWKLEDDEGRGGLSLTAQSRSALMAKLAGGKGLFPPVPTPAAVAPPPVAPVVPAPSAPPVAPEIEGAESFCLVIRNMFDAAAEARGGAPDWDVEIKQDVEDECGAYGAVLHSFVEKDKPGGLVYVLFDGVAGAAAAAKKLHGRWFNQRQISVRFLSPQEYVGMFPEVRAAVQSARAGSS